MRDGKDKIRVGKDKKSAEHLAKKIDLQKSEGIAGIYKLSEKDIGSFFSEIIDLEAKQKNLKTKTTIRYKRIVKNFQNFLEINFPTVKNLSQLNYEIFDEYIKYRKANYLNKNGRPVTPEQLQKRKSKNLKIGAADRTVQREIEVIKSFLQKAVKNRDKSKIYLRENPLDYVKPIKVLPKKPQPILTKHEVEVFLNYMKQRNKFLYELFLTLVYTGMLSGELIHLEWDDIDFEAKIITLHAKNIKHVDGTVEKWSPKTMKGKRKIPLHEKLLAVLLERQKECSGNSNFVFPGADRGFA